DKVGNDFVVSAGTVQGATIGTKFAVFQNPDMKTPPLGILPVSNPQTTASILDIPDSTQIPLPAYAVQTKDLNVHFTSSPGADLVREAFIKRMDAHTTKLFHYSFEAREQASLEVDVESDHVVFDMLIPEVQLAQSVRLPFRVKKDEDGIVYNVIHTANEFNRLVHLTPKSRMLEDCIQVQYVAVERKNYGLVVRNGENLYNSGGPVEVTAGTALYGIEIKNNSGIQLYPHLFEFNCKSHYRPPTVGTKDEDAPLQPGGTFTIGYGTGGKAPWSHFVQDQGDTLGGRALRDGQDTALSIFKLFFTTKPWDLSSFEQKSPFTEEYRGTKRENLTQEDEWDTLSIPVVIKRPHEVQDGSTMCCCMLALSYNPYQSIPVSHTCGLKLRAGSVSCSRPLNAGCKVVWKVATKLALLYLFISTLTPTLPILVLGFLRPHLRGLEADCKPANVKSSPHRPSDHSFSEHQGLEPDVEAQLERKWTQLSPQK
ncbi:5407_t:CDS:2, partial [Acaulospora colombiana]